MSIYIEYQLEDGITILVETTEPTTGSVTKAGRDALGNAIISANRKFEAAFEGVKKSATVLRHQLEDLRADEVEVTFGLKTTGEAGNFAIGQVGVEANYTVTLKWNNRPEQKK